MKNQKILYHTLCVVVLLIAGITQTLANCVVYPQPDATVNFGTVTVTSDIPVGGVIASQAIPATNNKEMECDAGSYGYFHFHLSYSANETSISHVYETNLQGIGVRVLQNGFYFTSPYTSSPVWTGPTAAYDANPTTVDLIKTSDTPEAGVLDIKQLAVKNFYYSSAEHQDRAYNMGNTTIVVPSLSCTVLTPTVAANLNNHLTTEFTGINSTTASVELPIKLSCPAGIMVYAKLDATADTATPQPGAIKLTPSSVLTASGVAIQIVDANNNGVPIGSISQFKPLTPTILNFGWKARYLQTAEIVAAGDANASATVTINYQ
ncbi:fimbrial protein [Cronobacter sakazakii]|uniref:fimbrial protein n=1 Tax=Cronobacter sakazakii TaxID=28141 RepID=UPI000CFD24D3|nr:fimbrial protein [Cronobacter sakazakii]ELY4870508.1 type 1 fimbrial protein [Cronobacter sakazakii]ELY6268650.1 type 1 fimbrial protein [Cronobacter sakazakii]